MSLDANLRSSADAAITDLGARVTTDLRAIVDQLVARAIAERDEAAAAARTTALQEAAQIAEQTMADLDMRSRVALEQTVRDAREQERQAAAHVLNELKASMDQQVADAARAADQRSAEALMAHQSQTARVLDEAAAAARIAQREAVRSSAVRLIESVRGLDGASSLSEVLDALGGAAAREATRAAVLVLRNERLLGWKLSGFGAADAQPKTIDLSLNECGIAGLAVTAARPISTTDSAAAAQGLGFAPLPADAVGVVVPVVVGGRVVAVVYADTGHANDLPGWQEIIEVLTRHAARCLEALTVQKVGVSTAPRFWVAPGTSAPRTQAPSGMTA